MFYAIQKFGEKIQFIMDFQQEMEQYIEVVVRIFIEFGYYMQKRLYFMMKLWKNIYDFYFTIKI